MNQKSCSWVLVVTELVVCGTKYTYRHDLVPLHSTVSHEKRLCWTSGYYQASQCGPGTVWSAHFYLLHCSTVSTIDRQACTVLFITAHTSSLQEGNVSSSVCQSVHKKGVSCNRSHGARHGHLGHPLPFPRPVKTCSLWDTPHRIIYSNLIIWWPFPSLDLFKLVHLGTSHAGPVQTCSLGDPLPLPFQPIGERTVGLWLKGLLVLIVVALIHEHVVRNSCILIHGRQGILRTVPMNQQESISVGWVPPACRPYLVYPRSPNPGHIHAPDIPTPRMYPSPWTFPHQKGPGTRDTPRMDLVPEIPPRVDLVSGIPP